MEPAGKIMEKISTTADIERRARVAAIRNSALVRAAVGITAGYEILPDGRHQVSLFDRVAGAMRKWQGATLDETITRVRREL